MDIASLRKSYEKAELDETASDADPLRQFQRWFDEAVSAQVPEPNAMTLATVGENGRPSTRVVLIKGFDARGFVEVDELCRTSAAGIYALGDLIAGPMLTPSGVDVAAIAERLKTWPRELPRPAPKEWIQQRCDAHGDRTIFFDYLDALCLHVVENEALYNHYITTISSHPRLRGDDGMPIVSMWRQPRGVDRQARMAAQ